GRRTTGPLCRRCQRRDRRGDPEPDRNPRGSAGRARDPRRVPAPALPLGLLQPRRREGCLTGAGDRFTPAGVRGAMAECCASSCASLDPGAARRLSVTFAEARPPPRPPPPPPPPPSRPDFHTTCTRPRARPALTA